MLIAENKCKSVQPLTCKTASSFDDKITRFTWVKLTSESCPWLVIAKSASFCVSICNWQFICQREHFTCDFVYQILKFTVASIIIKVKCLQWTSSNALKLEGQLCGYNLNLILCYECRLRSQWKETFALAFVISFAKVEAKGVRK